MPRGAIYFYKSSIYSFLLQHFFIDLIISHFFPYIGFISLYFLNFFMTIFTFSHCFGIAVSLSKKCTTLSSLAASQHCSLASSETSLTPAIFCYSFYELVLFLYRHALEELKICKNIKVLFCKRQAYQ